MSCILRLFQKKSKEKRQSDDSKRFSLTVSLDGPLPTTQAELHSMEQCLASRMSYLNQKASLAYTNAAYAHQNGDMRKYLAFMAERKRYSEELRAVGKRITEVVEQQVILQYELPPLSLPPPAKIDFVMNPIAHQQIQNVTNRSSSQLVNPRPLGRTQSHLTNVLSAAPPHLRGGPQWPYPGSYLSPK